MNGEAMMWASLDNELELMKEEDPREYKCADCIYFDDSFGYGFCENADSDYAYVEKNKSCCCVYKSKEDINQ